MLNEVELTEKYERNGWPSIKRPDLQPPPNWNLALVNSLNHIHHHALSPDGETIAFIWEKDGRSDIYTIPSSGGWPQPLSHDRAKTIYWLDGAPQWSPDGRFLTFTKGSHVHIVPRDGRSLPRNISDFTDSAWSPVWMPDSSGLICSTMRHDSQILLLTDRDGGWPRALTPSGQGDAFGATPSPDGRFIAYFHRPPDDLNRLSLHLVEVATGNIRELTDTPEQKDWDPQWSPDGQQIAFLSQRSGYNEIWLIRPDGQNMLQLTNLNLEVQEMAWSPDGRTLAATINRNAADDLALVDAQTGEVSYLCTGLGVYSAPQWGGDGRFLTVEYEDSTHPPDIYRVTVPDGHISQITHSLPPVLAAHNLITPEPVTYTSFDDLEIHALLSRPQQPNGAAILRPHGGPTAQYKYEWDILAQYYLAKGYTFFTPNFRGSTGYGVPFEQGNYNDWGIGDTQDVLHGARFLHTCDWIDPARLAIFGSSYGGYMVATCLAQDPDYLFACGVSKYGDAHLYSSWAQCERETRLYTEMQIGHPRSNWQVYLDGSPIWQVANIQKPVLLLHGLLDDIVPPQASEEWAEALKRHDKTFEYKTYADEPHGFLKYATEMDWMTRMERFLDWHLRV
jgi:dipeptidyl aminopeptidase/acylaminoacyl peptidase